MTNPDAKCAVNPVSLNDYALGRIAKTAALAVPTYDRAGLVAGIVHFGVGNFHRAHQAMAIDRLLELGVARDFAICGVGVMPGDARMRDVLAAQNGLYVLDLKYPDGSRQARVIGSIVDYQFAPDDPEAVVRRLAAPSTRIVSLTVTEGGYNYDQVTGEFDSSNPAVQHDLADPDRPRTTFGFIVAGLRQRRADGLAPFTVMSCDNLPGNGHVARQALTSFARLLDPALADWIAQNVAFPNSMVDRITPATSSEDRAYVRNELNVDDGWPVAAEPFFQWVLEDTFTDGRPRFELAGVQLVEDVTPYELMKLRLLNVSHQALAYFGVLAGYRYVDEAMADPDLCGLVRAYMDREGGPTLPQAPGIDLSGYKDCLIERFSSGATQDTLARLAAESSDRISKWLVPLIRENLSAGRSVRISAGIVASWARYADGIDEQGHQIAIVDRFAEERHSAATQQRRDPVAFLKREDLFGDLVFNANFVRPFVAALESLYTRGARETYRRLAIAAETDIVVFDLGGVLVTPANLIADLSRRAGCDVERFAEAYWIRRLEYDLGLDAKAYWTDVLERLEIAVTSSMVADLVRIDTRAWTGIRPDAEKMLERLHASGNRIAILSNATIEMADSARRAPWSRWISYWFFSAELGLAKPDTGIFYQVREALGVRPESIVYFDDSQRSVDSALAAGWNAHFWTSGDATSAVLSDLGLT